MLIEEKQRSRISYKCDLCKKDCTSKKSAYEAKENHFCSRECYYRHRAEKMAISKINFHRAYENKRNKIKDVV